MRHFLALILLALCLAPLAWIPLLTGAVTLRLLAVLAGVLLWLWGAGRDSRHSDLFLLLGVVVWFLGSLLWLRSSQPALWMALPLAIAATVALTGLLPLAQGMRSPVSLGVRILASMGLVVAFLINGLGVASLIPWELITIAVLLALPWSLPRCMAALGSNHDRLAASMLSALLGVAGLLVIAGGHQWLRTRAIYQDISHNRAPWETHWSPEEIDALMERNRRFPQPQGQSLLLVIEGLRLLEQGHTDEAIAQLRDALDSDSPPPAAVSAACWAWGRAGLFGPLLERVSLEQVIEARSEEAARCYLAALIAAGRSEDCARLLDHFGPHLLDENHPAMIRAFLGNIDGISQQPGLLFMGGRILESVTLLPSSPEAAEPLTEVRPGQICRLEFVWRLTHLSPKELEIRLRLGESEARLALLDSTERVIEEEQTASLGDRSTTTVSVRIPSLLPSTQGWAQLVVCAAPDTPLAQRAVLDLAPLALGVDPVQATEGSRGISEEHRHHLFGPHSEALHLTANLQGTSSVFAQIDSANAARRIAVISHLTGARQINQGQAVAEILVSDQRGNTGALLVLAGRDTAEAWIDYPPFQGQVLHGSPPLAWQTPRQFNGHDFHNSVFVGEFTLPQAMEIRALKIRSLLPSGTALRIVDIVLLSEDEG